MELREAIAKRHSVRKFQDKDVPDSLLKHEMAIAHTAPSAGAIRGYESFIVRGDIPVNVKAPVYIVTCIKPMMYVGRYGDRGRDLYSVQDATIFGAYLQLLLVDKGLSSCWVGAFRERKIQQIINTTLKPIHIIALGYELEHNNSSSQ